MGKGLQGALLRAFGAKDHTATVTAVEQLNPYLIRVDFASDGLLYPDGELPSAWIRAWFPDPEGGGKLHQRGYTFVDPDPATGTFGICFLVHEPAGPASSWAKRAQPGDELTVQRLGGDGYDPAPEGEAPPPGFLLMGDGAAWPALVSVATEIPAEIPVRVVIEYAHDDEKDFGFPERVGLTVTWVPTRDGGRALVDALGDHDYRGWKTWVTGESKATQLVRAALTRDHAQNKGSMHAQAYWVRGRAMGKSVDAGPESCDVAGLEPDGAAPTAGRAAEPAAPAATRSTAGEPVRRTPAAPDEVPVLRPARPALISGGVVALLLSLLQVVPLVLFAELARRLLAGDGRDELVPIGIAGVVVLGISALGTAALVTGLHFYDQVYAAALRRRVLEKLTRLPLGWFAGRRNAEVRTLVQRDIGSMHYLVTHAVPDLVGALVTPLAILGYLFAVDWRMALVLLIPVVVYVVVMIRLATADRPRLTRALQFGASLPGDAERYIAGQKAVRIFGDGAAAPLPRELAALRTFLTEWQYLTINTKGLLLQLNRPMTSLVVVTVAGTALITAGAMPAASLLPFLVLGTSLGDRLVAASYAANGLRDGFGAKASLDLLLGTPELVAADPAVAADGSVTPEATAAADGNATAHPVARPAAVTFDRVTFGYVAGEPVVRDLTLTLPPGGTTAVVGPSGAGKSTVAALAARLWDPDAGSVTLDGIDLRDVPEQHLRAQVAVVMRDVQLIRGTVHENIALGLLEATRAQVAEAARSAYIAAEIEALGDGYDTVVDRDSLSGGQRQRIAIARALLGDPRLVVLDEATAAADPDSEWEVRQSLSRLLAGRTVLVVAHRLHTIADADLIVVLDDGEVAEQGTAAELLAAGGLFADMSARAQEALR